MADKNKKSVPAAPPPMSSAVPSPTSPTDLSRQALIRSVTRECLDSMTDAELADPEYVEGQIINAVELEIGVRNAARVSGTKWRVPDSLLPAQIADIMARTYRVVCIVTGGAGSDPDYDMLAVYMDSGPDEGIYVTASAQLRRIMRRYNYGLTMREAEEVEAALRDLVPRVYPCSSVNLIAVNNGIFDYDTKTLLPFDPEKVFLTKSRVDYNPLASNVTIHNPDDNTDWDVESWMSDLSDDPEIVGVLWEILGAIIRPLVHWNKSAWFYSETGNNGKGTLCELMRQLCGEGSYASIPLADFGKDFMLEPLTSASAIIVDENDVGTFIDRAANLKAVITGDVVQINRKFKVPVAYQFRGFMVQCLNEMPRIKDKSDSFFRRQLFVPFSKCFTGRERKYIKDDYLHRDEVLQYVLYRVLNMDYYSLSVPASCEFALEEYKDFADPVREFLKEHLPIFRWDLVPMRFVYDCYCAWYLQSAGSEKSLKSFRMFSADVRQIVAQSYPDWLAPDMPVHPQGLIETPEPLIDEYNLKTWMGSTTSRNPMSRLLPPFKSSYRGLCRKVPLKGATPPGLLEKAALSAGDIWKTDADDVSATNADSDD